MREIDYRDLRVNPMTMFGDEWLALVAGNEANGCNVMTVAWGHIGALWERDTHANRLPTVVVYVRPSRYTKEFLDREPLFTLSLFEGKKRKALGYIGSHSGRDEDKIAKSGMEPVYAYDTVYFKDAKLVLVCRKLYSAPLVEEGFVDRGLVDFNYPLRDFHQMYIGEIVKVLEEE